MNWAKEEQKYIFQTYNRQPIVFIRARSASLWDIKGKKYLDFFAGLAVNNAGHCHPAVAKAVNKQMKMLMHTSNLYYTTPQVSCAKELIRRTFPGKVFFSNSGAEANECALKLSRRWGKKYNKGAYGIITFENSFHGRTLGTITLTAQKKYQKGFEPLMEKVSYARFNDMRSVKKLAGKNTCAVFLELIQGEGGVNLAERTFVRDLRSFCDKNKILLVFDEVQTGMGRTGKFLAYQHYGVEPDVITMAKGLGGGLPIGATIAKDKAASLLEKGDHASTFGGNPVVCSAAMEVMKIMDREFLRSVLDKGMYLLSGLDGLREKYRTIVQDARGMGLMGGLELKVPGGWFVEFCRNKGLLINCTHEKVLRFLPPLIVTMPEIKSALDTVELALRVYIDEGNRRTK